MRDLIDLFWMKYAQLKRAVDTSAEQNVVMLDREVESLLQAIFERKATNAVEIQMQFLVGIELLKCESEDRCCVLRHAENLQRVIERHLLPGPVTELVPRIAEMSQKALSSPANEQPLDINLLESLSDRVAVISPDYRYLFTNSSNALALNRSPAEVAGHHIGEFVGLHRFVQGLKDKLDRSFAGEIVDYTYADQIGGRTIVMRCRISPYYSASQELVGALLLMEEIADRRQPRSSAA